MIPRQIPASATYYTAFAAFGTGRILLGWRCIILVIMEVAAPFIQVSLISYIPSSLGSLVLPRWENKICCPHNMPELQYPSLYSPQVLNHMRLSRERYRQCHHKYHLAKMIFNSVSFHNKFDIYKYWICAIPQYGCGKYNELSDNIPQRIGSFRFFTVQTHNHTANSTVIRQLHTLFIKSETKCNSIYFVKFSARRADILIIRINFADSLIWNNYIK